MSRFSRDERIDFTRGLALLVIYTDHVQGNLLAHFMPWRTLGVSMAESFVFISGYVCGLSYGRLLNRAGTIACQKRAVSRCLTIYSAHLVISFSTLAIYLLWREIFDASDLAGLFDACTFDASPNEYVLRVLLLQKRVGEFDILPVYIVLLAGLPVFVALRKCSNSALFVFSLAIYLGAVFFDLEGRFLPTWDY